MEVLLLKDVYKLGLAGEVKKVAPGYARNFLFPRHMALLATPVAIKQAAGVAAAAAELREKENREKAGIAEKLTALLITFPARASEKGRLFGSITPQMIANAIEKACGEVIDRRTIMASPLRELGEYQVQVRLTASVIPTVIVLVHREGEKPVIAVPTAPAAEMVAEPSAKTAPAEKALTATE